MQDRLALNHGGTALLRAIERGHAALVELLLARGASPNANCACGAGETPLWTAAVYGNAAIVARLLARGADPNTSAWSKTSALHVARMRGYGDVEELLLAHGADPEARDAHSRTPRECGAPGAADALEEARSVWWTGVRALDLFSPLPARGLVRWTAPAGAGSIVLLGELAWRFAREGRAVLWTGFASAPLAANDLRHGAAELGVAARVTLALSDESDAPSTQLGVFERALTSAADALLVIFEATGFSAAIEARLPELRARAALTIAVAPFGASAPSPAGSPYAACVACRTCFTRFRPRTGAVRARPARPRERRARARCGSAARSHAATRTQLLISTCWWQFAKTRSTPSPAAGASGSRRSRPR